MARMLAKKIHGSSVAVAVVAGLFATLGANHAHAQSRYSMTTLGLGTPYQNQAPPPYAAWIDSQDRVWSNLSYYEGKKLVSIWDGWSSFPFKLEWRDTFTTYPVRHAGTGSTLAASKLSSKRAMLVVVSPNGQRAYLTSASGYTPVSPSPAVTLQTGSWPYAIQDSGAYTGRIPLSDGVTQGDFPALWVTGQPRLDLPVPDGARGGVGLALNSRNEVAGVVYSTATMQPRAAVWRQGQLSMLDDTPGQASFAMGISELGHVLVASQSYAVEITEPTIPNYRITEGALSHSVFYNGQRLSLACPSALPLAQATAISPGGLVVGQCTTLSETSSTRIESGLIFSQLPVPSLNMYRGQAWIWKDGVGTELASYLTARGVVLPAGMVLRCVMAANAKGSMVVLAVNAAGQPVLLRFTASN